jgi:cyclophilin family peptidyl-prolyl cis-trans isomerase
LAGKLQRETDEKLRVAVIAALRKLKSDQGVAIVRELLTDDASDNLIAAALEYLASVQRGAALAVIDSVLNVPRSAYVRAAGARAYALIGDPGVNSRLGVKFGDEDPIVRVAAFEGLVRLDTANIDFYMNEALNDNDYVPTVAALEVIKGNTLTEYLPVMGTMMSRGGEIDVELRRAILDALDPFIKPLDNDSVVLQILIDGVTDPSYVVRREAAAIYRNKLNEDRSTMVPPTRTYIDRGEIEDAIGRYEQDPSAVIVTNRGEIEIELLFDLAPLTVINFIDLAESKFYDGLTFHRVVPNFVIQGGDPRGDGWGGPAHYIRCEYSNSPFIRGSVGMATSGKDTGGSQFFIMHSAHPHLDARYTLFGHVINGMDVVDQIVRGDVIERIIIEEGID